MGIRLSKSALDKFERCARCFYLQYRYKLGQPDLISSKVWKGTERIGLAHYEAHRLAKTTPPDLIGQVPDGAIPYQADRISMKDLRYWGKGLSFLVDGITVTTALDDMLQRSVDGKTIYNCIDLKSKSKATDEQATIDLYANQAGCYDLAMNVNDYRTDGVVYFAYSYPMAISEAKQFTPGADVLHGLTTQLWGSQVVMLRADHERIKKLVLAAAACLDGPLPEPNIKRSTVARGVNKGQEKLDGCPVCLYVVERESLFKTLGAAV